MGNDFLENRLHITRKHFLGKLGLGFGSVALGSLLIPDLFSGKDELTQTVGLPHFAPKAKRIIYLFQNGAPSQLESFDYKPLLNKMTGEELPEPKPDSHGPGAWFLEPIAPKTNN